MFVRPRSAPVLRAALLAGLGLSVTACADPGSLSRQTQDANLRVEAQAQDHLRQLMAPGNAEAPGTIRVRDAIWLGAKSIRSENGEPLPAGLEKKDGITLISPRPMTLAEISAEISAITGLPVRIDLSSGDPAADQEAAQAQTQATLPVDDISAAGAAPTATLSDGTVVAAGSASGDEAHSIEWTGPMSGLLDFVGAKFNVSWEYREGGLRIFRYVTESIPLYAMPGTSDFQAGVGGEATGGDSSSGDSESAGLDASSTQRANVTAAVKIWEEIEKAVTAMLPAGSTATFSQATGTVNIVAPPASMRKVRDYIMETNKRLLRQVAFNVQVLEVTLTDDENYNFDLSEIINKSISGIDLGFKGVTSGAGAGNDGKLSVKVINGDFAGSTAVARALSQYGHVSVVTSAAATTLNNQPVPIQIANETSYLKRVSVTTTGSNNPTTSSDLEPGTVTTGFGVTLLPRVMDDGRILTQFSLSLSSLQGLNPVTSGGQTITTPTVDRRSFLQQVLLRSGDTLVLSGFEQNRNSTDRSGIGSPNFWLLGGGRVAKQERAMVVVLITPTVLSTPSNSTFADDKNAAAR